MGGLGAWRDCGRCGDAVRVLHAVYRRIRGHDSGPWRPSPAGARRRWLSRAFLDRPADGVGVARPAVSSLVAVDAVRHRVAESIDRRSVHRRPATWNLDAWTARDAWRSRRHAHARRATAVPAGCTSGGPVGR